MIENCWMNFFCSSSAFRHHFPIFQYDGSFFSFWTPEMAMNLWQRINDKPLKCIHDLSINVYWVYFGFCWILIYQIVWFKIEHKVMNEKLKTKTLPIHPWQVARAKSNWAIQMITSKNALNCSNREKQNQTGFKYALQTSSKNVSNNNETIFTQPHMANEKRNQWNNFYACSLLPFRVVSETNYYYYALASPSLTSLTPNCCYIMFHANCIMHEVCVHYPKGFHKKNPHELIHTHCMCFICSIATGS